jgi:hypothetical protein
VILISSFGSGLLFVHFRARGKYKKLPEEFKKLIHKDTQTDTQNNIKSESLNLSLFLRNQLYFKSRGWELNPHIAALQAAA